MWRSYTGGWRMCCWVKVTPAISVSGWSSLACYGVVENGIQPVTKIDYWWSSIMLKNCEFEQQLYELSNYLLRVIPTLPHYSDIVSDTQYGSICWIYIYIYSEILSDILSGIYADILSGILSGIYSNIPGIYSDILFCHSTWHPTDAHWDLAVAVFLSDRVWWDLVPGEKWSPPTDILPDIYPDMLCELLLAYIYI